MKKHKHGEEIEDYSFHVSMMRKLYTDNGISPRSILPKLRKYLTHLDKTNKTQCPKIINHVLHVIENDHPKHRKSEHHHIVTQLLIEYMVHCGYGLSSENVHIPAYKALRNTLRKHHQTLKHIEDELTFIIRDNLQNIPRPERMDTSQLNHAYLLCHDKKLGCLTSQYAHTLRTLSKDIQHAIDCQKDTVSIEGKNFLTKLCHFVEAIKIKELDDTERTHPLYRRASG